jgi:transcriptional regulator with XRE-family HTH domain
VNDALIRFGKRVQELRTAKKWSQEEFAHISGLHRTYIGQIERGEKNVSFANLLKLSGVLGLTLSELFLGLEQATPRKEAQSRSASGNQTTAHEEHQMFEVQKLVTRLSVQRTAMDRTITTLEELACGSGGVSKPASGQNRAVRRQSVPKK